MRLNSFAKDLEESKPKLVLSVLNWNIPKMMSQVDHLAMNEDGFSDYSNKLCKMEEAEQKRKDIGFVRLRMDDLEKMLAS